jgi:hypothetical protein
LLSWAAEVPADCEDLGGFVEIGLQGMTADAVDGSSPSEDYAKSAARRGFERRG